jgi:hypothetical protein
MSKKQAAPAEKQEKKRDRSTGLTHASKSSKVQAILAPRFGLSTNQVQRVLGDAEASYEAWRKDGFRGAWWKRYFKNETGEASS